MEKQRCKWCNLKNPLYVSYHDYEWCRLNLEEDYLFEMLLLESFQAGLSWECVLNKREDFRIAYDNFDIDLVSSYDDIKVQELLSNPKLIRNRLKVNASIGNAQIFKSIQKEFGSFQAYLKSFAGEQIIVENDQVTNALSDLISNDLKKRGMKFVGSTIIYSYLQAIGIISSHEEGCFMYQVVESDR
ncbi:MAG: DNA-3-methyladenine glycosylase I [Bacilli bacterium]|nr:DNA-3-methyladenine glycosylase I [Bacilli bacterium]